MSGGEESLLFWELDVRICASFDLMNTLYKLVNLHYLKVMYALISNSKLASKLHADTSPSTSQPPLPSTRDFKKYNYLLF